MGRRPRGACPATVYDADGADLVMERIDGRALLDGLETHPWRLASVGRLLADLHHRLDAVPVAEWMPQRGEVERPGVVHCDLHPDNVMLTADGPVLIDWTRGGVGDRRMDLAHTWLIVAELGLPPDRLGRAVHARPPGTARRIPARGRQGRGLRMAREDRRRPHRRQEHDDR